MGYLIEALAEWFQWIGTLPQATLSWLLDRGFDMLSGIVMLFPDASTSPYLALTSFIVSPIAWTLRIFVTLIDAPTVILVFGVVFIIENTINTIAFMKWLWSWIKW